MRDDFSQSTKRILAQRVGDRCSNPACQALTSGPNSDPSKATIIGVAAHISSASPGGPRYNSNLSKQKRKDPTNGIWLCQNCGKLVDNDEEKYPVEVLLSWKTDAENLAGKAMGKTGPTLGAIGAGMQHVFDAVGSIQTASSTWKALTSVESDFENIREAWREGKRNEVSKWLVGIKGDKFFWDSLDLKLKARILGFEALYLFDEADDTDGAKKKLQEAMALDPTNTHPRLRALIVHKEEDQESALKILDQLDDIDSLNLKAALFMDLGRFDDSEAILKRIIEGKDNDGI